MTRKDHWNEKKVEDQLRKLPSMNDKQNKDDLFLEIQKKMEQRENEEPPVKLKRKKTWFFPAVASVAAVLVIMLIIPSFLKEMSFSSNDEAAEDRASDLYMETAEVAEESADHADDGGEAGIFITESEDDIADDTGDGDMEMEIMQGPLDEDSVVIPAPYMDVNVNFGETIGPHVFLKGVEVQVDEVGETLEEQLYYVLTTELIPGAVQFDGLNAIEIDEMTNTVTLDFSENALVSLSAAEQQGITQSLHEVFGFYGYEEVVFTTEGEYGVDYGQTGPLEGFTLQNVNRGYYVYEVDDTGERLLLQSVGVDEWIYNEVGELLTFEEAVEKMTNVDESAWFDSPFPDDVDFDIVEEEGGVVLLLADDTSLDDTRESELFVEAMLLTARDFDYDYVRFENTSIQSVGKYLVQGNILLEQVVPNRID